MTVNEQKDPLPLVFALIAVQLMGGFASQLSPLLVGGLMAGFELSESQAGYIVFIELSAVAFVVLMIAPLLPRFTYRSLCLPAALLAIVADIVTVSLDTTTAVAVCRLIAGLAEGVVYAVSLAAVASTSRNPDRLYGIFQVSWAVTSGVLFSVGGYLSEQFAHRGLFGLMAVATLLLLPLLKSLPQENAQRASATGDKPVVVLGLITFAGVFVYLVGSSALYAFSEPLGARAGLSTSQIGYTLSSASILGLSGAILATWLNIRKGRVLPISGVLGLFALNALVLCGADTPAVYVPALMSTVILYYFSVPYCFGLAAALDHEGRWAAAVGSAYLVGFAVGPAVGGNVIEWSGYTALAWLVVLTCVVSWAMLMLVIRQLPPVSTELAPEN